MAFQHPAVPQQEERQEEKATEHQRCRSRQSEDTNSSSSESALAKELGLCAIDSWNMNAWHAGIATASKSSADVVLLQEARIDDKETCLRAEDAARANGWAAKIK